MGSLAIGDQIITPAIFSFCNSTPPRFLYASGKQQLTLKAGTRLLYPNGDVFNATQDMVLNTTASADYKLVYIQNETLNVGTTVPEDAILVGGFFGVPKTYASLPTDHPLSGYVLGDIIPNSVWCRNFKPDYLFNVDGAGSYNTALFSNASTYCKETDSWIDIYNMGTDGLSRYGNTRCHTKQHFEFSELLRAKGKTLLSDDEFFIASQGSNQKTSVQGSAQPNPDTTGGHLDTAGRSMVSNIGCEEMCGLQWQHLQPYTSAGGANWNGQAGNQGDFYGSCMVLRAGGGWDSGSRCGSRCRSGRDSLSYTSSNLGARGRSPNRETLDL